MGSRPPLGFRSRALILRTDKPPRWLKPVNGLVKAAHRIGIPTGPAMLLTVAGHRTGKPRSTPMSPLEVNGRLYVVAGFPNADWVRNARAAGMGTLTRGRRRQQVRIIDVGPEEARPVLRAYPRLVPAGVGFVKRSGLVADGTPDEFEALAGTLPVLRFDPLP
jgi:deazaflavin-dependent oxidoreductase (nitroreductase family)